MDDIFNTLTKIARDGARPHQLRFARERLEDLRISLSVERGRLPDGVITPMLMTAWIAHLNYAIAQIEAAEGK